MGALVKSLDALRDQLRCHVAAVHHLGKDAARGPRGHSLLKAAVDTVIEIARDQASAISTATVVKERDSATEGEIMFKLRQIELGHDQDGGPVTSCVVEAADVEERATRKAVQPKLSAAQGRALQLLAEAIDKGGDVPSAGNHIPAATRCVAEETWRQYCYRGAVSDGDQHAKRVAFKRAAEALVANGRVGKWEPLVWIV